MAWLSFVLWFKLYLIVSVVYCNDKVMDKRLLVSDQTTIQDLEAKIQDLTQKVSELATAKPEATFIRWGRSTCPNNVSELVYNGYAGGSWYDYTGGAVEYICMPSDPQYEPSAGTSSAAFVYGVEYDHFLDGQVSGGHVNDDAPCSVCRTTTTSNVLMIPGRTTCYPGWTMLYKGSLACGSHIYRAASQYVCVDHQPEFLPNGANNDNGKLFAAVSSRCGSLKCPPYVDYKRLSCVVCAK